MQVAGVELVKADLLGPLLPGVRRQVDLLVSWLTIASVTQMMPRTDRPVLRLI